MNNFIVEKGTSASFMDHRLDNTTTAGYGPRMRFSLTTTEKFKAEIKDKIQLLVTSCTCPR